MATRPSAMRSRFAATLSDGHHQPSAPPTTYSAWFSATTSIQQIDADDGRESDAHCCRRPNDRWSRRTGPARRPGSTTHASTGDVYLINPARPE